MNKFHDLRNAISLTMTDAQFDPDTSHTLNSKFQFLVQMTRDYGMGDVELDGILYSSLGG